MREAPLATAVATFRSPFDLGYNVTSGRRTEAGNRAVGGVPNSQHVRGSAFDAVPRRGETMQQLAARLRRDYPGATIIPEGDHVHVQDLPGGFMPYHGKRGTI